MSGRITKEELMKFLDRELDPDDHRRIEREIAASTELRRDLARYRMLRAELASLGRDIDSPGVWTAVQRRLTRPVGWILLTVGAVVYTGWAAWLWANSESDTILKLGLGAVTVGFVLLLVSVLHERWVAYQTDPYRDIQR
jgi:anti-sigma factor RsiW